MPLKHFCCSEVYAVRMAIAEFLLDQQLAGHLVALERKEASPVQYVRALRTVERVGHYHMSRPDHRLEHFRLHH